MQCEREIGTWVTCLQGKGRQGWPVHPRKLRRGLGQSLLWASERTSLLTPWSWTSGLQPVKQCTSVVLSHSVWLYYRDRAGWEQNKGRPGPSSWGLLSGCQGSVQIPTPLVLLSHSRLSLGLLLTPGQPGTHGAHLGRITGLEAGGRRLTEAIAAQGNYPLGMETVL